MLSIKELAGLVGKIKPFEAKFETPYRAREVMKPWDEGNELPAGNLKCRWKRA